MSHNAELFISAIAVPADSEFAAIASWDHYKVHQIIASGFGDLRAVRSARILFRFDIEGDRGHLFIQSQTPADWSRLDPGLGLRVVGPKPVVLPAAEPGTRLRFRLLARPTKRVGNNTDPRRGRRVFLDNKETKSAEADQRAWLDRKGVLHGFTVDSCALSERRWHDSKRGERLPNGQPKPLTATLFDGILVVTDPDKLRHAVRNGIGTQKAFGFGLLSIAPVR